jgi:hypothetical protein
MSIMGCQMFTAASTDLACAYAAQCTSVSLSGSLAVHGLSRAAAVSAAIVWAHLPVSSAALCMP